MKIIRYNSMKAFFDYNNHNEDVDNSFVQPLDEAVNIVRLNPKEMETRNIMIMRDVDLKYYAKQEGLKKGLEQGLEQGLEKGKAKTLIAIVNNVQNKKGWTLEETLNFLDVSKEEYEKSQSILAAPSKA